MLTIYGILNILRKVIFPRRPLLNKTVPVRLKQNGIVYSKVGQITEAFSRSDDIV